MVQHTGRRRLALIIALLSIAIGVLVPVTFATPASAAFPGRNGRLAFEMETPNHDYRIFTMRPDGTGLRLLRTGQIAFSPAWGPNGRLMLYAGEDEDIWMVRADGTHEHTVLNHHHFCCGPLGEPAWSPDGTQFAFTASGGNDACVLSEQLFVYTFATHTARKLTHFCGTSADDIPISAAGPRWSPRGDRIVFTRAALFSDLFTIAPNGTHLRRITRNYRMCCADWAPGGARMVSNHDIRHGRLVIRRPDGTPLRRIPVQNGATDTAWSPDGKWIAYLQPHVGRGFRPGIWLEHPDGTDPHRILKTTGGLWGLDWQALPGR